MRATCPLRPYPSLVPRTRIPDDVLSAAHARARARGERDWAEADRLRDVIAAAGWKVVDRGTDFALTPTVPPDIADERQVRYGTSANVPSRLDDPAEGVATIVLIATDFAEDLARALAAIQAHAPAGCSVVIVADGPSAEQSTALDACPPAEGSDAGRRGVPVEVVTTSERLGQAAAVNIGIRRARAPVVVLLDTSIELTGDAITPLVEALADPTVAIVGGWGISSTDLRRFEDAPAGEVDAIEGYCQAFRRTDAAERGPLDERFQFYRNLDVWWSLVLRDAGEGEPPRRAVRLDGLPMAKHEHRGWVSLPDDERDRRSRRNFYRIIDRFGWRRDLLTKPD